VNIGLVHLAGWESWVLVGVLLWIVSSILVAIVIGRAISIWSGPRDPTSAPRDSQPTSSSSTTSADASAQTETGRLMLQARDLSRLLEVERAQRRLLQQAYRQTTTALADALEAKDRRTGLHALRVQRYALELTSAFDRSLLDDPGLEHGFLLHDTGKIAISDRILDKPGPLTDEELEVVHEHPVIGEEILRDVSFLHGEALRIVRSHHERWDGTGYPDRLAENAIPVGARIFAVADALDALTTDRPYRHALSWSEAIDEVFAQDGRQFDPRVISAFAICEPRLRLLHSELAMAVG
jgi:HD-GYP domain-containing protein (c-di-GMP phosphodiesterase class II)